MHPGPQYCRSCLWSSKSQGVTTYIVIHLSWYIQIEFVSRGHGFQIGCNKYHSIFQKGTGAILAADLRVIFWEVFLPHTLEKSFLLKVFPPDTFGEIFSKCSLHTLTTAERPCGHTRTRQRIASDTLRKWIFGKQRFFWKRDVDKFQIKSENVNTEKKHWISFLVRCESSKIL